MADDTKMAGRRKINEPARTGLTGKNTGHNTKATWGTKAQKRSPKRGRTRERQRGTKNNCLPYGPSLNV